MSDQYPTNEAEFRTCAIMKFEQLLSEMKNVKEGHQREMDFLKHELFGDGQPGRLAMVESELVGFREKVGSLTGKVLMLTLFVSIVIAALSKLLG